MANISVYGPILLSEQKNSDKTVGQTRAYSTYDSRLARGYRNLSYHRIREIRRDPTVQLARDAVVSPILHTPWNYEAKEGAPKEALKLLQDMLEPLRDWFLQNAVFGALDFGWAPFEVVQKVADSKIVITKFKQLLHDFTTILVYINNGEFAGFVNEPMQMGNINPNIVVLTPYALNINLCVEGTDWYGESISYILDPICTSWDDVQSSANRYDKKIAGATWVVYYPAGETPVNGVATQNSEIARAILNNLESSGTVAVPDEVQEWLDDSVDKELKGKWRVELISPSQSVQSSFIDRQKYLDNLKMRAFGIPERSILEGVHGTKAESETHADVSLATIDTKHRLVCAQLNEQVVKPWMRLNYGEQYENSIYIKPAPLVDAQFQTVKEIYRLIMQSPQTIEKEIQNIDVQALRDSIGVPTIVNASNDYKIEPKPVIPFAGGKINPDINAQNN